MTVEERLAEWLQSGTPEPPRELTAAEIAARVSSRPSWPWRPLLAAACVVLAAALAVVIATDRTHHTRRPATSPEPSLGSTTSVSPSPSASTSSTVNQGSAVWHARIFKNVALWPDSVVSDGSALFALQNPVDGSQRRVAVVRIDPTTGRIRAREQFPSSDREISSLVIAAGRVWVLLPGAGNGELRLQSLTTDTLAPEGSGVSLDFATGLSNVRLSLATDGTAVYVGAGERIFVIDAHSGQIARHLDLGISVTAIGPTRGRLFVGTQYDGVYAIDPNTGAELERSTAYGDAVVALQVSARGVWVQTASGMQDDIWWNAITLPALGVNKSAGGSTQFLTVDVSGSTAWLGGPELVCADADTGVVHARAPVRPRRDHFANVGGIAVAGGRVFATAGSSPGVHLVQLHPPKACSP